jgi:hypothetical protein
VRRGAYCRHASSVCGEQSGQLVQRPIGIFNSEPIELVANLPLHSVENSIYKRSRWSVCLATLSIPNRSSVTTLRVLLGLLLLLSGDVFTPLCLVHQGVPQHRHLQEGPP